MRKSLKGNTQASERTGVLSGAHVGQLLAIVVSVVLVFGLWPSAAFGVELFAATQPTTGWYYGHEDDDTFVLSSASDLEGLAQIVNGGTDNFCKKTVTLSGDINGYNNEITPIGTKDIAFEGTFDGAGYRIDNLNISAGNTYERAAEGTGGEPVVVSCIGYTGLFGHTGEHSTLKNVTLGSTVSIKISIDDEAGAYIDYMGILVGYCEGSISNVTSSGTIDIYSNVVQKSADDLCTVECIGGIAGVCYKSLTNCATTADASISIVQPSAPVADFDESSLVFFVGGIAGFEGDYTQQGVKSTTESHGTIENCTNAGSVFIDTPSQAGVDRFGEAVSASSTYIAGVAGYARGSVIDCTNTAYLNMMNAMTSGGIVGCWRSFRLVGDDGEYASTDEGSEDDPIVCERCVNDGIVYARATVGGIIAQAGTYTTIIGCMNGTKSYQDDIQTAAFVIGTRWNKPFIGGIVGRTYGTVCYCANLGVVASASSWDNFDERTVKSATGYYSAGIAGGTEYFTEVDEGTGLSTMTSPMSQVYNCYNAGKIETQAGFRSGNVTGENNGETFDNAAQDGMNIANDNMFTYGEKPTDTSASGSAWNNLLCVYLDGYDQTAEGSMKGDGIMTYKYFVPDDTYGEWIPGVKDSVFQQLNSQAVSADNDFSTYWMASPAAATESEQINSGYPVLNWQAEGYEKIDLSDAELELIANAAYDGGDAIPSVRATLNGTTLLQNVDFKVIPQTGATDVTGEGDPLYTAYIEGIGAYTGTSIAGVDYAIDKGSLSSCTVSTVSSKFNWTAQEPGEVTVKTPTGTTVDPSEYSFDLVLAEGEQAVNVGAYTVLVTANPDSKHFEGTVEGTWRISTVNLMQDVVWDGAVKITYMGQTFDWYSTVNDITEIDWDKVPVFPYTGHPIKPSVSDVIYLNHALTEDVDYTVLYGDLGSGSDSGGDPGLPISEDNIGTEGEITYGAVMVRYVPGSNFHNYMSMIFVIDGTSGTKSSLYDAVVSAPTVVYEDEPMRTVTVSYAGQLLTEGVDYEITYTNNNAPGTASYVITGIGLFEGTLSGTFEITDESPFVFTTEVVTIDGTTGVSITGFTYRGVKDTFDIVIPDTLEVNGVTYPVIAIGDGAFGGKTSADFEGTDKLRIDTVTIPASVISIGSYAFGSGASLTTPTITQVIFAEGSQLAVIGEGAFANCTGLTEFTFPAGVTTIGSSAFSQCSNLTTLVFDTTAPDLPSSVASNSFTGVGSTYDKVRVLGFASASTVRKLVEDNSTAASSGTGANGGKNFYFVERAGDLSQAVISPIADQAWTGSAVTPAIEVYLDGVLLSSSNYTLTFTNNIDVGVATVTATGTGGYFGTCSATFNIVAPNTMSVYAGADRYATANAIASSVAESGPYAGVIVCSGVNGKFADALCASGLSGVLGYPVVLVNGSADTLDASSGSAISSLLGGVRGDVIILGGTATVSSGIQNALTVYDSDAVPLRVAGDDRYATSEAVYTYGAAHGGWATDYAVLAIGNNFPDALGAASFCTTNKAAMLLTNRDSATLESYVKDATANVTEIVIAGGTTSIPNEKVSGLTNTVRLAGTDRYATNIAFASWELEHGMSLNGAGIATGTSFPDSLGSNYLLSLTHSVLLLSSPDDNSALYTLIRNNADTIHAISILGGENSVPESVRDTIQDIIGGMWEVNMF